MWKVEGKAVERSCSERHKFVKCNLGLDWGGRGRYLGLTQRLKNLAPNFKRITTASLSKMFLPLNRHFFSNSSLFFSFTSALFNFCFWRNQASKNTGGWQIKSLVNRKCHGGRITIHGIYTTTRATEASRHSWIGVLACYEIQIHHHWWVLLLPKYREMTQFDGSYRLSVRTRKQLLGESALRHLNIQSQQQFSPLSDLQFSPLPIIQDIHL